jgi:hypothetical protein
MSLALSLLSASRPALSEDFVSRLSNIFLLFFAVLGVGLSPGVATAQPWHGSSSARLEVTPKETEVYVDGYLAGSVDDFDGFAQRLRIPSGEHELEFYLAGHRSIREKVMFQPGETYRITHRMEPLATGETAPVRPRPDPTAAPPAPPERGQYDALGNARRGMPEAAPSTTAASISIRVQPADAAILIDGERWEASDQSAPLVVQVNEGTHRVEVRKDGYQPFSTSIQTRAGEVSTLNVSLSRQ